MTGLDGQDRWKAPEAQLGYTRNPRDTRNRQSSRFDRRMASVSRQRKQQSSHVYIITCSHHVYISYNRKSRRFSALISEMHVIVNHCLRSGLNLKG